jgi:hypothetical protein
MLSKTRTNNLYGFIALIEILTIFCYNPIILLKNFIYIDVIILIK